MMKNLLSSSAILNPNHLDYPSGLALLQPSPLLYATGLSGPLSKPVIGIVGTENPTPYGIRNTIHFSKELVDRGFCLCTGIQEGVSSIALNSGLRSGFAGICVGLCHAGIAQMHFGKFKSLVSSIQKQGYLYSEYADDQMADPRHIDQNGRLLAALSDIILVIESSLNPRLVSIVQWGLELGKDILVIPGPINDLRYGGNHYLIKNGAQLVETPQDIYTEFSNFIK
jgi:DNA processing protein